MLLKNAISTVVANHFEGTASANKISMAGAVVDTGGYLTWLGNTLAGNWSIGEVGVINGATTNLISRLLTGYTFTGKYQDAGSCYGTTPALLASWSTAGSLGCLGDNRAAVAMPHGADTSALFSFDVSGIDLLSSMAMTIAPLGVLPSGSGYPKFKMEWACAGAAPLLLGDASVPYSAWTVYNVNSWNGGYETQLREFAQLVVNQTGLPSPCTFLQVKITRIGTDSGDTKAATLSLVGVRVQYYTKTN